VIPAFADAGPRVEPRAQAIERRISRRVVQADKAESGDEEAPALVEHGGTLRARRCSRQCLN
jgi:hypothetical protein